MTRLEDWLFLVLALPLTLSSAYLLALTLLSAAPRPLPRSSRTMRFDIVVPAHNEEAGIQRTVNSLRQLDWPKDCFRIRVVADNCNDQTAALARSAGAEVIERFNDQLRGKGYALATGFAAGAADGWARAVVVIDADAEASGNLLEAFASRIERGEMAVQAHYGVLNPWASWRTRLITIAKGCFHIVRSRARERLGVSCGIRGNGWCVTYSLLERLPFACYSLTEDVEYGIELGLAGVRVAYTDEAHADADMVSGDQVATRQRQRWEDGRFRLIRSRTLPLLRAAFRQRSAVCLDLALDLMVLPLSYVILNATLLVAAAGIDSIFNPQALGWLAWGLACVVVLLLYVLRGWQLSGIGARALVDFARVPGFLLWKVVLLFRRRTGGWVRTDREI